MKGFKTLFAVLLLLVSFSVFAAADSVTFGPASIAGSTGFSGDPLAGFSESVTHSAGGSTWTLSLPNFAVSFDSGTVSFDLPISSTYTFSQLNYSFSGLFNGGTATIDESFYDDSANLLAYTQLFLDDSNQNASGSLFFGSRTSGYAHVVINLDSEFGEAALTSASQEVPVPEPATLTLLASGFAAIYRKRRRL